MNMNKGCLKQYKDVKCKTMWQVDLLRRNLSKKKTTTNQ